MKNEIKKIKEITGKTVFESADSENTLKVCRVSYAEEQILRPLVESFGFKTYGGDYSFYVYR
jgi:hypothetical protein